MFGDLSAIVTTKPSMKQFEFTFLQCLCIHGLNNGLKYFSDIYTEYKSTC